MLYNHEDIIRLGNEAHIELIAYETYNEWLSDHMDVQHHNTLLGLVKDGMCVHTLRQIEEHFGRSYSAIILDMWTDKLYFLTDSDVEVIVEDVEASHTADSILDYMYDHATEVIDIND